MVGPPILLTAVYKMIKEEFEAAIYAGLKTLSEV